jgi:hypothetical protein
MKKPPRERTPRMNASSMVSALQWAEDPFGPVQLGDQRRTKRAVAIASASAHNPAASWPAQMPDEAALEATSRFEASAGGDLGATDRAAWSADERGGEQAAAGGADPSYDASGLPAAPHDHGPLTHWHRPPSRLSVAERAGRGAPESRGAGADASGPVSAPVGSQGRNQAAARARVAGVGAPCASHRHPCRRGAVDSRGGSLQRHVLVPVALPTAAVRVCGAGGAGSLRGSAGGASRRPRAATVAPPAWGWAASCPQAAASVGGGAQVVGGG